MKTPITYYGGKQSMLKHILPLIPEHQLYTESFVGGAAVLFAKENVPVEVINDLNGELVNFYWVAQVYYHDLKPLIDTTLHSREHYSRANNIYKNPGDYTPVERAWALWTLSKLSFASKLGGSFGFNKKRNTMPKKIKNAKDAFTEELCARLDGITIESDNAIKVIQRYDHEGAFHFVDPPYVNSNCGHYTGMFTEDNLEQLLQCLARIKGKFMLTMYPHEKIRNFIDSEGWELETVMRTISASKTTRKKKEEWIVMNY